MAEKEPEHINIYAMPQHVSQVIMSGTEEDDEAQQSQQFNLFRQGSVNGTSNNSMNNQIISSNVSIPLTASRNALEGNQQQNELVRQQRDLARQLRQRMQQFDREVQQLEQDDEDDGEENEDEEQQQEEKREVEEDGNSKNSRLQEKSVAKEKKYQQKEVHLIQLQSYSPSVRQDSLQHLARQQSGRAIPDAEQQSQLNEEINLYASSADSDPHIPLAQRVRYSHMNENQAEIAYAERAKQMKIQLQQLKKKQLPSQHDNLSRLQHKLPTLLQTIPQTIEEPQRGKQRTDNLYIQGLKKKIQRKLVIEKLESDRKHNEMTQCTFSPVITNKAQNLDNYMNIVEKTEIFQQRQRETHNIREIEQREKEMEECTFSPKFNERSIGRFKDKSLPKIYDRNVEWLKRVQDRNEVRQNKHYSSLTATPVHGRSLTGGSQGLRSRQRTQGSRENSISRNTVSHAPSTSSQASSVAGTAQVQLRRPSRSKDSFFNRHGSQFYLQEFKSHSAQRYLQKSIAPSDLTPSKAFSVQSGSARQAKNLNKQPYFQSKRSEPNALLDSHSKRRGSKSNERREVAPQRNRRLVRNGALREEPQLQEEISDTLQLFQRIKYSLVKEATTHESGEKNAEIEPLSKQSQQQLTARIQQDYLNRLSMAGASSKSNDSQRKDQPNFLSPREQHLSVISQGQNGTQSSLTLSMTPSNANAVAAAATVRSTTLSSPTIHANQLQILPIKGHEKIGVTHNRYVFLDSKPNQERVTNLDKLQQQSRVLHTEQSPHPPSNSQTNDLQDRIQVTNSERKQSDQESSELLHKRENTHNLIEIAQKLNKKIASLIQRRD